MESARAAWAQLKELDSLVIQVIVDNETDGLSSACDCCDPRVDPETRTVYASEFTTEIQVHWVGSNTSSAARGKQGESRLQCLCWGTAPRPVQNLL